MNIPRGRDDFTDFHARLTDCQRHSYLFATRNDMLVCEDQWDLRFPLWNIKLPDIEESGPYGRRYAGITAKQADCGE